MGDYLCGLMVLVEGVDRAEGSQGDMDGDYFYRFLVRGLCSLITERCPGGKNFNLSHSETPHRHALDQIAPSPNTYVESLALSVAVPEDGLLRY